MNAREAHLHRLLTDRDGGPGRLYNPLGYIDRPTGKWERGFLWHKRRQVEVFLDRHNPMTFGRGNGLFIQPDRHGFSSDSGGSVPEPLRIFPCFSNDRFPCSYRTHDSACREHVLYCASSIVGPFVSVPVDSESVHFLLGEWVRAEGGNRALAWVISDACRVFGPRWDLAESLAMKEVLDG